MQCHNQRHQNLKLYFHDTHILFLTALRSMVCVGYLTIVHTDYIVSVDGRHQLVNKIHYFWNMSRKYKLYEINE